MHWYCHFKSGTLATGTEQNEVGVQDDGVDSSDCHDDDENGGDDKEIVTIELMP